MQVSVIIPCYNTQPIIHELIELTVQEFKKLGIDSWEFVLVNDCSPNPNTLPMLKVLAEKFGFVKVIDLAKNAGQANAQLAALNYTSGDIIINMDDDMQTHPSNIPLLYEKLCSGYDVVVATYRQKKDNVLRRFLTHANNTFENIMIDKPKELSFTSFWIIKRFVKEELIRYHNPYSFISGLLLRTSGHIANVEVEHYDRIEGTSGYNLKKLIRLWLNFTNFTIVPLRIAGVVGAISAIAGFIFAIITIINKIINPAVPAGYPTLLCIMLLFFGTTLISLGILGEYIGRIFMSINMTPQYVVREITDLSSARVENDKRDD